MDSSLIKVSTGTVAASRYVEFGTNDELQISYKSNGKNYVIETYEGERYELLGSTIESISNNTPYSIEYVMDIMFVIYNEYDNFKSSIEVSDPKYKSGIRKYTKKFQDKMVNTITSLLQKYNYEDVLAYFKSMRGFDLLTLFNGEDDKYVLDRMNNELTPEATILNVDEDEEREYQTGIPNEPEEELDETSYGTYLM
jgi:hypothetical protein